jgi:hypothetical protein
MPEAPTIPTTEFYEPTKQQHSQDYHALQSGGLNVWEGFLPAVVCLLPQLAGCNQSWNNGSMIVKRLQLRTVYQLHLLHAEAVNLKQG